MKIIPYQDLVPMDLFLDEEPIAIDLVYANADHPRNIFDTKIYHDKARMWAHKDIAAITILAARNIHKEYSYIFDLKDCLRTVECQEAMQETNIVKTHPEWCEEGPNRLLSPPGRGGHPRAMAIDICVLDNDGNIIGMGTEFDEMTAASARDYKDLPNDIQQNRKLLEGMIVNAAIILGMKILPLPSEWWDFRFYADHINQYEPLRDSQLPPQMQMHKVINNDIDDLSEKHLNALKQEILERIEACA